MESALQRSQSDDSPLKVFSFDNGLTLVHHHFPTLPVVVADVWVKAGAIAEPQGWPGVAHFLEHMVFKGSQQILPGMFDQLVEQTGGMANAATSHDYAHYYLTTASQYVGSMLPALGEILLQAQIPSLEIDTERQVVLEEIRSSYDDPDWLAFQCLCQLLYPEHPYGRSVLGETEDIQQLTVSDLRCFHHTLYQPENMTVVMVGDLSPAVAIAHTEKAFAAFPERCECPPQPRQQIPIPPPRRRQTLTVPDLGASRLTLGWSGPGMTELADNIGLDLLAAILAGSHCSRLVQHCREELGLVFDIHSCFSLQKEASLFTITAHLLPEQAEQVEAEICHAIHQVNTTLISPVELSRVQRLLCNDYIFSTETPAQLAALYGYYQTLASVDLAIAYPGFVRRHTPQTLQDLAQRYLSTDTYACVLLTSD